MGMPKPSSSEQSDTTIASDKVALLEKLLDEEAVTSTAQDYYRQPASNLRNRQFRTPSLSNRRAREIRLFEAVEAGNEKRVDMLFHASPDIDIDAIILGRDSALHLAAAQGHLSVTQVLLSRGANQYIRDENDRTPIERAIWCHQEKIVNLFIQQGFDAGSYRLYQNYNLLHVATFADCHTVVPILIAAGLDVLQRDDYADLRPIDYCEKWQRKNLVKQLEDDTRKPGNFYDSALGLRCITGCHVALFKTDNCSNFFENDHVMVMRELFKYMDGEESSNIRAVERPLLHTAIMYQCEEATTSLIDKGHRVHHVDKRGNLPIHLALRNYQKNIASLLLRAGADINSRTPKGLTILQDIATSEREHNPDTAQTVPVRWLLANGFTGLSATDDMGRTALHSAVIGKNVRFIEELLTECPLTMINAPDKEHRTALHLAVLNDPGHVNAPHRHIQNSPTSGIVEALLVAGAHVNAQDIYGDSALHIAAREAFSAAILLLLQYDANINLHNYVGKVAADSVSESEDIGINAFLVNITQRLADYRTKLWRNKDLPPNICIAYPIMFDTNRTGLCDSSLPQFWQEPRVLARFTNPYIQEMTGGHFQDPSLKVSNSVVEQACGSSTEAAPSFAILALTTNDDRNLVTWSHTYSQLDCKSRSNERVMLSTLLERFPSVEELRIENRLDLLNGANCQLLHLNTTLHIPRDQPPDISRFFVSLELDLRLKTGPGANAGIVYDWFAGVTNVYASKQCVYRFVDSMDPMHRSSIRHRFQKNLSSNRVFIPLGRRFLESFLYLLAKYEQDSSLSREYCDSLISNLTIVQQVWLKPKSSSDVMALVAVILCEFSRAENGEKGRAHLSGIVL